MTATNKEVEELRRKAHRQELAGVLVRSAIPERMHGGLIRFVVDHIRPGDFLMAVVSNDLARACAKADDENKHLLFAYVSILHNWAPALCWGSDKAVSDWLGQE